VTVSFVIIVDRPESFCWGKRLARRYAVRAFWSCLLVQDVEHRGTGTRMRKSESLATVVIPLALGSSTMDIVADIGHDRDVN
jgi:hypothetical protein